MLLKIGTKKERNKMDHKNGGVNQMTEEIRIAYPDVKWSPSKSVMALQLYALMIRMKKATDIKVKKKLYCDISKEDQVDTVITTFYNLYSYFIKSRVTRYRENTARERFMRFRQVYQQAIHLSHAP